MIRFLFVALQPSIAQIPVDSVSELQQKELHLKQEKLCNFLNSYPIVHVYNYYLDLLF
jgi:hypothetical protein